jgi:hypothetical protein
MEEIKLDPATGRLLTNDTWVRMYRLSQVASTIAKSKTLYEVLFINLLWSDQLSYIKHRSIQIYTLT